MENFNPEAFNVPMNTTILIVINTPKIRIPVLQEQFIGGGEFHMKAQIMRVYLTRLIEN